ncbi:MAG: hypothetical protein ACOYIR_06700 [Christensenellales bacterium]|jgi:hypothetical protein
MRKCVIYERECIECGECNLCDLEPGKLCDNCMRCVEDGSDYHGVIIKDIIDGIENALPVEPALDQEELQKAWQELKTSGFWKSGEDDGL